MGKALLLFIGCFATAIAFVYILPHLDKYVENIHVRKLILAFLVAIVIMGIFIIGAGYDSTHDLIGVIK
jgi:quinol-cytochrome oxidoreductase complex cytochrome b subunit